jgi:hypothetical protein
MVQVLMQRNEWLLCEGGQHTSRIKLISVRNCRHEVLRQSSSHRLPLVRIILLGYSSDRGSKIKASQVKILGVQQEHAGTPAMTINLPLGDLEHEWFTTCVFGESINIWAYIKYVWRTVWRNVWRILLSFFVWRDLWVKSLKNTLKFSTAFI